MAVSNRIDDLHHGCSEFSAIGETVPIGVYAPVLPIPAYGYPRTLRINVAAHAAIVALPAPSADAVRLANQPNQGGDADQSSNSNRSSRSLVDSSPSRGGAGLPPDS